MTACNRLLYLVRLLCLVCLPAACSSTLPGVAGNDGGSRGGSEALIYQQQHSFVIQLRAGATPDADLQRIIAQFTPDAAASRWQLRYADDQGLKLARDLQQRLFASGVPPTQVNLHQAPTIDGILALDVVIYRIHSEACPSYRSGQPTRRQGCSLDTLRLQQLVDPARLIP